MQIPKWLRRLFERSESEVDERAAAREDSAAEALSRAAIAPMDSSRKASPPEHPQRSSDKRSTSPKRSTKSTPSAPRSKAPPEPPPAPPAKRTRVAEASPHPKSKSVAPPPPVVFDPPKPVEGPDGEAAERRLDREIRGLPAAIERRSQETAATCRPARAEVADLAVRLKKGVEGDDPGHRGARAIEILVGLDFGTSSTKVALRLPYEAGSPIYAVPVPAFARTEDHPYLWASRIWLDRNGIFSLTPLPHSMVTCAIKSNLMRRGVRSDADRWLAEPAATAEETASAFLALQLRQARGWFKWEHAATFRKGRLLWSYNFGFPAASLADETLRGRYRRCCAAALRLVESSIEVSLDAVREALSSVRSDPARLLERERAALIPEIAAAVSGFASSTMLEDGLYAMVDVGGGTVDCCSFNLFKNGAGGARCPIFTAQVSMLGVEPWQMVRHDATLANYFRWRLDLAQRTVIWRTKKERYPTSERWTGGLPLFFIGGGVSSDVHMYSAASLDLWLREQNAAGGGVRVISLPPPENLDHALCVAADVHRLAVAVGLSFPATDIPDVTFPDAIADAPLRPAGSPEEQYIGMEQV